jgi:predicted amidohydrolase
MSRPLPVALVQAPPHPIDEPWSAFADEVSELVTDLPATRLVVYPELHLQGADRPAAEKHQRLADAALTLDDPRIKQLAELAGDLGIWLVPGSICERGADGHLYNTTVVLSPAGKLVAHYRKIFPWRPYEPYHPGDRFVTVDLDGLGRVGLSICYDAWFPELTRHLAWMGAEVVLNVVKTTTVDRAQEVVLARANAIVNQVFMISVNAAAPVGVGQSLVVDPEGLVRVAAPSEAPTVLTDVLDLDHVTRAREFGTAGLNRMWRQFRPGDEPLALPLYEGRIDPAHWVAGGNTPAREAQS